MEEVAGRDAAGGDRTGLVAALITGLVWATALSVAIWRVVRAGRGEFAGYDFAPLYGAGLAERLHEPLYAVPNFVYPPFAALVFVPLSLLPYPSALLLYRVLAVGALVLASAASTAIAASPTAHWQPEHPPAPRWWTPRWWTPRWWTPAASAGSCAAVLLAAHSTARSLGLANASLFLPLVLVVVCWAWGRGRWGAGTALLVASLVVKPVLLALLVLPLARRRGKDLLLWCGIGAVLSLAALVTSTGARDIPTVVAGLLHASHFQGREGALNLSLAGIAAVHHVPALVAGGARLAVLGWAAAVTARWARSHRDESCGGGPSPVVLTLAMGTVATATLFLAGSISEVHYELLLVPGVVTALGARRRWAAALAAGAVLAYLAAGGSYRPGTQELLVAAQLLALAAASIVVWRGSVQVGSRGGEVLGGQAAQRGDQRRFPDEQPAFGA